MSTKTIQEELNEVIAKNLPAQVGETLKVRLEQAEKDAKTIKLQEESIEEFKREIKKLHSEIEEYMKLDVRNALLETREKAVEKAEIKAEVENLKIQLAAEKDKSEFAFKTSLGLVRNTEFKKTIFDSYNPGGLPVIDGHGMHHYPITTSKNYSETSTEE